MAKKRFKDLSEREILALAIQLEEEDSRVYADFADGLRADYPATSKVFEEMQAEESRHRQRLIEMHQQRFGSGDRERPRRSCCGPSSRRTGSGEKLRRRFRFVTSHVPRRTGKSCRLSWPGWRRQGLRAKAHNNPDCHGPAPSGN